MYDFFVPMQIDLERLKQEIISLDNELDDLIYSLYSIDQAEATVINDYFKKYKNDSSLF